MFIRCSPPTFPLEAAAVRLGQLESEERVYIAPVNRVHVILALLFIVIGLVLVFDAISSHDLEWPLGLFLLVIGVVWIIGVATLTLFLKPQDAPGLAECTAGLQADRPLIPTNTKLFRI